MPGRDPPSPRRDAGGVGSGILLRMGEDEKPREIGKLIDRAREMLLSWEQPWESTSFEELRIMIDRDLRSAQLSIALAFDAAVAVPVTGMVAGVDFDADLMILDAPGELRIVEDRFEHGRLSKP